jgi:hypothetical protein
MPEKHIHKFIINGYRTVGKSRYKVLKCAVCGFEKLVFDGLTK